MQKAVFSIRLSNSYLENYERKTVIYDTFHKLPYFVQNIVQNDGYTISSMLRQRDAVNKSEETFLWQEL